MDFFGLSSHVNVHQKSVEKLKVCFNIIIKTVTAAELGTRWPTFQIIQFGGRLKKSMNGMGCIKQILTALIFG